jgi:hypothetical protein
VPIPIAYESEIPLAVNVLVKALENPALIPPVIISFAPSKRISTKAWEALCSVLIEIPSGYALIVDEAWNVQKAGSISDGLQDMIRSSGNRPQIGSGQKQHDEDFTIIQTSHRFSDFATKARFVATDYYIARTTLSHDIEALEKTFPPSVAYWVQRLKDHEFLHIREEKGNVEVTAVEPSSWYAMVRNQDRLARAIQ